MLLLLLSVIALFAFFNTRSAGDSLLPLLLLL